MNDIKMLYYDRIDVSEGMTIILMLIRQAN